MVDEPIRLDLQEAFAAIEDLFDRLSARAGQAGADVASTLASAIGEVDSTIDVQVGDPGALTSEIDAAVGAAETAVPVSAETGEIPGEIDAAVAAADAGVVAHVANPDEIAQTITEAVEEGAAAAQPSVPAFEGIEFITPGVADNARDATDAVDGFTVATTGARAASAAATGEAAGFGSALGGISPKAAGTAGAVLAVTTVLGEMVQEAAAAEAASAQLDAALGDSRAEFEQFDLAGFNEDLSTLALRLGQDDDAIRAVVARTALLGRQTGATNDEIVRSNQLFTLLAARAAALDPSLGSIDQILERLPVALSRGGRFAQSLGISLTSAEIAAEALAQGITRDVSELSVYERATLGAEIATRKLGDSLRTDVDRGASLAITRLRRFRQELREGLEAEGATLVEPVTQLAEDALPILQGVIRVVGAAGRALVGVLGPIVEELGPAISEALGEAAEVIEDLLPLLELLGEGLARLVRLAGQLRTVASTIVNPLNLVGVSVSDVTGAVGDAADATEGWVRSLNDVDAVDFEAFGRISEQIHANEAALRDAAAAALDAAPALGGLLDDALTTRSGFEALTDEVSEFAGGLTGNLQAASEMMRNEFSRGLLETRELVDDAFFAILALGDRAPDAIDDLAESFQRGSLSEDEFRAKAIELGLSFDALAALEARVREETERFGEQVAEAIGSITDAAQNVDEEGGAHIASFVTQVQEQALAAAAFANSIQVLFERGADDLAQALLAAGQDAAGAAAEAARASDEQLAAFEGNAEATKLAFNEAQGALTSFSDEVVSKTGEAQDAFDDLPPDQQELLNDLRRALQPTIDELGTTSVTFAEEGRESGEAFGTGIVAGVNLKRDAISDAITSAIEAAESAARAAAEIGSPSRLFAREIGFPLTEGIAEGIVAGFFHVESAIEEVFDGIQAQAETELNSLFDSIQAGRGLLDAQEDLTEAQRRRNELIVEQATNAAEIGAVEAALSKAVSDAQAVTAREQQAIERARRQVEEIQKSLDFAATTGPQQLDRLRNQAALEAAELARLRGLLAAAQANAALGTGDDDTVRNLERDVRDRERTAQDVQRQVDDLTEKLSDQRFTTLDLIVAQEDLEDARRRAVGPTEDVERLERELDDLYRRQAEIGPELVDATDAITDAQLRLLEATANAALAGQAFFEEGNRGIETLLGIGEAAGLGADEVNRLVDSYARLTQGVAGGLGGAGGGTVPFPGSLDVFGNQSRFASPSDTRAILNFIRGQAGEGEIGFSEFERLYGRGAAQVAFNIYGAADPQATAFTVASRLGLASVRG